jgi:hypothetical protein
VEGGSGLPWSYRGLTQILSSPPAAPKRPNPHKSKEINPQRFLVNPPVQFVKIEK